MVASRRAGTRIFLSPCGCLERGRKIALTDLPRNDTQVENKELLGQSGFRDFDRRVTTEPLPRRGNALLPDETI